MDDLFFVFLFQIAFWGFLFFALIYLIFKQIKNRKKETFEKRDN